LAPRAAGRLQLPLGRQRVLGLLRRLQLLLLLHG
jgi:hypothetical protein